MFIVSGPRIANTTVFPSGEASTSFTSYEAVPVTRRVMFVSVALGEAVSRLKRFAAGITVLFAVGRTAVRSMRRSSVVGGIVRLT